METQNSNLEKDFHAVDYMRNVRKKMSELYLSDRGKYLEQIQKAMTDFKLLKSQSGQ